MLILKSYYISDDGHPTLQRGEQSIKIPSAIDGIIVERAFNFVIVKAEGLGFTIKWDQQVFLVVKHGYKLCPLTNGNRFS